MDTTWKRLPGVQCVLGESVGVVELATDCIADFILVILPVRLLWSVKLAIPRRKLLMAIFSASIITTVVSVVHTVYVFSPNRNAEGILAHVEASTSLIICNLAVLVTWMARVIFRGYDMDSPQGGSTDPSSVRGASRPNELSTLRFEHPAPIVLHSLDEPRLTDNKALTLSNTSIEHDRKGNILTDHFE
ncbi:hypothetical protein A0H81_02516 [Grifola frondosa]|uniref:Rhodopsin domain-containing protein n=1 Tax=Grifola frondosa TaxID=5627 RepID=A0A1C7MKT5_GRIFR|nr:hypothetical protein A0H81_02516 [Grifola frondosa]